MYHVCDIASAVVWQCDIDSRRGIDAVRPLNVSPADRNTPHEWVLDEFAHARTRIFAVIVVTAEIRSHPVPSRSAAAYTARATHRTYTLAAAARALPARISRQPPPRAFILYNDCQRSFAARAHTHTAANSHDLAEAFGPRKSRVCGKISQYPIYTYKL